MVIKERCWVEEHRKKKPKPFLNESCNLFALRVRNYDKI